jgi:hypothetical protein
MKLEEVIEQLSGVISRQPNREWKLFVKVFNPGTVGGTPCVSVKHLNVGFDWDNGKVMIETDVPLTTLTPEDVAAIHKSAKEGQSWHAFQSFKKQAERIKALESEITSLKATRVAP